MSDFTKLQKDKILNHLYKNFKKIDFDNIDQDIFFKKIGDLDFFDKKELLLKISSLFFEDLDQRFLSEVKSKVNKITKTNEKISFLLNKRLQIEKKNKDLIKKIFIHLIKDNNSNKVLTYIYSVSDIMWKYANDRSVDFNFYTKRLILSSVYLKILILSFYKDNLTQKDLNEEISKSLEHVKLISQFKMKLDFFKNLKEFFSSFSIRKAGRGFLKDFS
jgi:ubiquinone biosynthesis protein COQ9